VTQVERTLELVAEALFEAEWLGTLDILVRAIADAVGSLE
jgi:hypothetical protein